MRAARIGLTGGIGSGKSTVGQLLCVAGAALVDADQIARDVTGSGGAAIAAIHAAFGADFIDALGALDREKMRALAFTRPDARSRLESIVHPLVGLQSEKQAQEAASRGCPLIVFDVPLLVESGRWARRLDAVIVVDCDADTQVMRVMQRNSLTAEVVRNIIASQATRSARRAAADILVANGRDRSLTQLAGDVSQVAALFGL
ncbi:dephospho-CoA kinase [Acidovorax sp.]|uniref:dephospho-CoA kinase n=1 Tax=Acidovorax sp. TaxID=1872122 RepID=UPI0025B8B91A|nr:dephospho-CoA kinase [Acidovorax sp.]